MRSATITIDTQALAHNVNVVKRYAPNSRVLAMVKANAYGHGIANCLPALTDADAIGVAYFEEGKQARLLGWDKTVVLIEGVFSAQDWQRAQSFECQSVIHQAQQLTWVLDNIPDENSPSRTVWLKINTGMNRLGFEPHEAPAIAQRLKDAGYHIILTSHFANADIKAHPSNVAQISVFKKTLALLRQTVDANIQASLCNSAALINFPECHYDWVRPGIMLYGSSPTIDKTAAELALQPVMTFTAKLIAAHTLPVGECVGYGSHYIATQQMTKGIVSIGYGDGYPRVINKDAWVSLHDTQNNVYQCPIIGRVSMDMLAIDISAAMLHSKNTIETLIGCSVGLWGNPVTGYPSVDAVATYANTVSYELLCRLTPRPSRQVLELSQPM